MTVERGPKFVSGEMVSGRIVLTRDDASVHETPVLMINGAIIDNGDGTCTLTIPEE